MAEQELRIGWKSSAVDISLGQHSQGKKAVSSLSGSSFCIVTDDAFSRSTIRQIFQDAGISSTSVARSFKDALQTLARRRHDAIVLDTGNNGRAAKDFVSAIRGHEDTDLSRTPVIMITDKEDVEDLEAIEEIKNLGINSVLLKPFSPTSLLSRVRKVLKVS